MELKLVILSDPRNVICIITLAYIFNRCKVEENERTALIYTEGRNFCFCKHSVNLERVYHPQLRVL